jgi:hypothetical protein
MLDFYLSGGAGNTNPNQSIGGARSSQKVVGIAAAFLSPDTISGVSIADANGLYLHTGSTDNASLKLVISGSNKLLIFTPYRETAGTINPDFNNIRSVTADGTYTLVWTDTAPPQTVTVTVTAASLPAVDTTARLAVTRTANGLFDNTLLDPGMTPVTDYRCVYMRNDGSVSVNTLLRIERMAQGSVLSVGLDPLGVGGQPSLLGSELTPPSGVVFTQPTTDSDALPVTLGATQQIAVWLRRTTNPVLGKAIIGDSFGLAAKVVA